MSGYRSARERSPTPYPRDVVDSSSDADPSEDYMIISSDSEDSSIQILPSPPRPPPVIIDLTMSPLLVYTENIYLKILF